MSGGTVSDLVELITLHLAGGRDVQVVRKRASPHEAVGLAAAQAIRPAATAVPELIACGEGAEGTWIITLFLPGAPPNRGALLPANLFDSLARLHARFHGAADVPEGIPRVDLQWWRRLCLGWVLPQIDGRRGDHSVGTVTWASSLISRVADHPAVRRTLSRLIPTLLHGDVHPGNVLVEGRHARLIDWGSCRVGPAMLDLANLVPRDSDGFAVYRRSWEEAAGRSLDTDAAELGYRWAALQIPVQYLPWTIENQLTADVEASLDRAERALAEL
ncbi:hypothetical protein SRB5_01070 [Streptomyces sp. RB5]|uniref:Aminoglycoside phosphotransferase domain-containing protein n=1 Tax=Streptomyces smaragdinus TaxID=2585196 RepID=A0A7K0C9E0_9ACTN|nr:phosphotransferase [Streptomyces smaragdinus]MQY10003.1 hypothetical protein [Streptomyces smaragdinus]